MIVIYRMQSRWSRPQAEIIMDRYGLRGKNKNEELLKL